MGSGPSGSTQVPKSNTKVFKGEYPDGGMYKGAGKGVAVHLPIGQNANRVTDSGCIVHQSPTRRGRDFHHLHLFSVGILVG